MCVCVCACVCVSLCVCMHICAVLFIIDATLGYGGESLRSPPPLSRFQEEHSIMSMVVSKDGTYLLLNLLNQVTQHQTRT